MKLVSKIDKSIMLLLQNNVVRFVVIAGGVAYLLLIKKIPTNLLKNYNNIYVRVIIALAIAYLACFEPMYAVVLATLFILSLQELQRRSVPTPTKRHHHHHRKGDYAAEGVEGQVVTVNDQLAQNKFLENVIPDPNGNNDKNNTAGNPADQNLTENLSKGYITDKHLRDAQNNLIAGSDPDKPVEVFDKILNAQGMMGQMPVGIDKAAGNSSKF